MRTRLRRASTCGGWTGKAAVGVAIILRAASSLSACPELSATTEEYAGEGVKYRRLVFKDDARRIEMELPNGWDARSSGVKRLDFLPRASRFAEVFLALEPPPATPPTSDATLELLKQRALSSAPETSEDVILVRQDRRTDGPDGRECLEVVISYKILGYTFLRSVALVELPDCRLLFQVSAPDAEFAQIDKAFRRALATSDWP